MTLTNAEIIERINAWQAAGFVHELTCGVDSRHEALVAKEIEGKVVLTCVTCDYLQAHIPPVCLSDYVEQQRAALKKLGIIPAILCAILLQGCTFDCHIECDLLSMLPAKAKEPKPTVESRDVWLDVNGRALAQEHGWTLTMIKFDPATPTLALYHLTRSLIPLPAEKP